MRPERNVEPVIRVENLDNEEIEEMINRIRNIIQQREYNTTGRTSRQNWTSKLWTWTRNKRVKRRNFKKNTSNQIHESWREREREREREKLCYIRLDKRATVLINRAKIATKEILRLMWRNIREHQWSYLYRSLCCGRKTEWKTKEVHK